MNIKIYDDKGNEVLRLNGFITWLQFRLFIVKNNLGNRYFIKNKHDGFTVIDRFGVCEDDPFKFVKNIYLEIIEEQKKIRTAVL